MNLKTRFLILRRDGFTCQYCGARAPQAELHVDHVQPIAKGGTDHAYNLITACRECNQGKRDNAVYTPDHIFITQIAQYVCEHVRNRFGRSVNMLELFSVVRRNIELNNDPECTAREAVETVSVADDYDDFIHDQREMLRMSLELRTAREEGTLQ